MRNETIAVAKVPIHFLGFLANVNDSITGLRMGNEFAIERKSNSELAPFLRQIDKHYGLQTGFPFLTRSHGCVVRREIAQFEGTPQGGVAVRPHVLNEGHKFVRDKCHLLGLFKEGNIVLAYSFLYHIADADEEVKPFGFIREYPILDTTPFALTTAEKPDTESFLRTTSLPLPNSALQLALESFDKSYETDDAGLAFLSLMIAMEVVLNPSDHELRYRVSRNAGVLLGRNRNDGETVYREMKELYDRRSKLVHTGDKSVIAREDVLRLRHYVRETIKEAMKSRMSKEELLNTLNACGLGERPWREGR